MLSVVTITYNNFNELKSTLDSLRKVKSDRMELIVIDGGSCQKSRDYLDLYEKEVPFPVIRCHEKDRGISDAFNKGILLSKGEGITFLNSGDTLLDPSYYDWADQILKEDPTIDFAHSNIIFNDPLCGPMERTPLRCKVGRGMPYFHQTMVVRKKIFAKIGSFDLNYKSAMDFHFVCRMQIHHAKEAYFAHSYVVAMDGQGISTSQERYSLEESLRALKETGLWKSPDRELYYKRLIFFSIRDILRRGKATKLLSLLKKIKNHYFKNKKSAFL